MSYKLYLSLPKYANHIEYLRTNKNNILIKKDIKNFSNRDIRDTVLIAIDRPCNSDLLLPFKKRILYRLEYNVARTNQYKYDIYFYAFFFDLIFEWDSNYYINSKSFLPFFPPRVGILHESNQVTESLNIDYFLKNNFLVKKKYLLSTIVSNKSNLVWHKLRLKLIFQLKSALPEIDLFGRGFKSIKDKSIGLINYKYHIASENSNSGPSEKLWDPLLCQCIVFYVGSLDLVHPYLRKAIIPLDLNDINLSLKIIKKEIISFETFNSISNQEWIKIKDIIIKNYSFENTIFNHQKYYF